MGNGRTRESLLRHGFATEAATALATFGFTQLELPRIVALIHPANVPSIRVADKMGFRYCRTDSRRGFEQLVYELWRKESTNVGQDGSGI
jgi:RimJ/RimL family protein N-acetyltransferase